MTSDPGFPYLLLPAVWATRNRARRRQRGDTMRGVLFGGVALAVCAAIFGGAFWLTWELSRYSELGDYLLRLGLSWLFLTFLSFLAFSGVVASLSTFFLADDLRLLMAAPVAARRLFYARFARTVGQASWMVVVFLFPLLAGVGVARCAAPQFYAAALLVVVPFVVIPVALGTGATLVLVNVFPARRARDILMLMGLLFAGAIVVLLRFIQPERLMRVESLPDITDFFATLQSPITPLLPSFWAGEALFASLQGGYDLLHAVGALDDGAGDGRARRGCQRAVAFRRLQQVPGSAQGAIHAARPPRQGDRQAADVRAASAAPAEGSEGVPARREPVVTAPAARRLDARVSLQLSRAGPRAHPLHERRRQERLRAREPGDGGIRDGNGHRAVRLSRGVRGGTGILDYQERACPAARLPVVQVLDGSRARAPAVGDAHGCSPTSCSGSIRS